MTDFFSADMLNGNLSALNGRSFVFRGALLIKSDRNSVFLLNDLENLQRQQENDERYTGIEIRISDDTLFDRLTANVPTWLGGEYIFYEIAEMTASVKIVDNCPHISKVVKCIIDRTLDDGRVYII